MHSLDVFIAPPPVEENKFETQVRCMSTKIPIKIEWEGDTNHNTAKKSWYTYSFRRVVEVIVLTRILDHLMRQIAISDGWMHWQKYPKIEKCITGRIQLPTTLDSNICPTYPGMGYRTLACICRVERTIVVGLLQDGGDSQLGCVSE